MPDKLQVSAPLFAATMRCSQAPRKNGAHTWTNLARLNEPGPRERGPG